jgi:acyl-CoA thioester hydrolase
MQQKDSCINAVEDSRSPYNAPARKHYQHKERTHLKNVRESLVHFGYELIRASDGVLLAEGETTHIVTDAEMKTCPIPEKYAKAFRDAVGKTF